MEEEFDGEKKTSIQVKNESNIACYLRVCLVSYWKNKEGEIVGKPSVLPEIEPGEKWKKGESEGIFYYKLPVGAGETTESNLLRAPLVLGVEEEDGETVYQVVEVFAEAIQAEPEDAVEAAWPSF